MIDSIELLGRQLVMMNPYHFKIISFVQSTVIIKQCTYVSKLPFFVATLRKESSYAYKGTVKKPTWYSLSLSRPRIQGLSLVLRLHDF